MARPSKYNEKYHVPWVRGLAKHGLTVEEIAEEIGVAKSTLHLWAKKHEELSDALNDGREIADLRVEESLYQAAIGAKSKETRKLLTTDSSGRPEIERIEVIEKEHAPSPVAGIFWLKNRKPRQWRDRPDTRVGEEAPVINITIPAEKLGDGS